MNIVGCIGYSTHTALCRYRAYLQQQLPHRSIHLLYKIHAEAKLCIVQDGICLTQETDRMQVPLGKKAALQQLAWQTAPAHLSIHPHLSIVCKQNCIGFPQEQYV